MPRAAYTKLRPWIAILALILAPHCATASAWLQPENHGQWIVQSAYYSSTGYFNEEGQITRQPRFRKLELQPYIEYGLLRNLTVGATGYADYVRQSNRSNHGLADPEIFARTILWQSDLEVLSIQPLIKFKSHFTKDGNPRSGSRSNDVELSILYGRKPDILSPNDYYEMRAAYRYRTNGLNDQWRTDASLGLEVAPNFYVIPAFRTIIATKLDANATFSENADQDYDLMKAELGLAYRYSPTDAVGLTAFKHVMGFQTGNGMGVIASYTHGF